MQWVKIAISSRIFTSGRSTFWTYDILTMIKNNPIRILFGNGVNYLFKINYAHFGNPLWAHNDFIQIFSDYGLFGLLVYLGMFITLFKKTFNGIKIYLRTFRGCHCNIIVVYADLGIETL